MSDNYGTELFIMIDASDLKSRIKAALKFITII